MKIKNKLWYSLEEAAIKLKCTQEDILYLGITGKLKCSFDWAVLIKETPSSSFIFTEVYEVIYCEERQCDRELSHSISAPDYYVDPIERLANLSIDDIALIKKNDEVCIQKAYLSEYTYFTVCLNNDGVNQQYPKVKTSDLIIKVKDFEEYLTQHLHSAVINPNDDKALNNDCSIHAKHSDTEINNANKTIALLTQLVADVSKKNPTKKLCNTTGPNISAIAKEIDNLIPPDGHGQRDTFGLSKKSFENRYKAGMDLLNS